MLQLTIVLQRKYLVRAGAKKVNIYRALIAHSNYLHPPMRAAFLGSNFNTATPQLKHLFKNPYLGLKFLHVERPTAYLVPANIRIEEKYVLIYM